MLADSFAVLVEQGVVDPSRLESLRGMACLRNGLVHLYWEVDDVRIHGCLSEGSAELMRFAQTIASHPWH